MDERSVYPSRGCVFFTIHKMASLNLYLKNKFSNLNRSTSYVIFPLSRVQSCVPCLVSLVQFKKQLPSPFSPHLHALFAASPLRRGGCGLSATIAARKRARRFCKAFQCLRFKLGNRPKGLRLSEGLLRLQGWQGLQGLVRRVNYSNPQTIIALFLSS